MCRFSEIELDERRHELRCFGREARGVVVRLAPQPFRLLLALVEARGALVTREDLGRWLWDEGTFVDAEASGAEAPIETLPRLDYWLSVPAERAGTTLALAVTSDGRFDGESIARAFEAELVAALLDGAAGRGEVLMDPAGEARADARLEARIFEIPSGFRDEFRPLQGKVERSIADREAAVHFGVVPWFAALRSDPRFQEFVRCGEREGRR